MNSYQNAVQALKQCVKDAIDNDVNPTHQSEIWRHYQGMKAIEKQVSRSKFSFKLDALDNAFDTTQETIDYLNSYGAAQPVDNISISTGGDDVITFS